MRFFKRLLKAFLNFAGLLGFARRTKGAFFTFRERLTGYAVEKRKFKTILAYELNLNPPESFNEKIIWKKLHDRNPLLPLTADKYRVREYVKQSLGDEAAAGILIPLLYVTDRPETIPFAHLPSGGYRIKANCGSGRNIFVRGNNPADPAKIIRRCKSWLETPYGLEEHEWAYQKIERKIIIEELLPCKDPEGTPADYKFFVFHGRCELVEVILNRFKTRSISFLDPDWNLLPVTRDGYPRAENLQKPNHYGEMRSLANRLGAKFDFVRVDLYFEAGRIYFGEMTHYPVSGHGKFIPQAFDFQLGSKWKIVPRYWERAG